MPPPPFPNFKGLYLEELQNFPAVYQSLNFPAARRAEEAYLQNITAGTTGTTGNTAAAAAAAAAAQAAKDAFVADGFFVDVDDPFTHIKLTSSAGQAFLATAQGERLLDKVATAAGSVATQLPALESQFTQIIEAFYIFGFWYRPAYGAHPLANGSLSDAEILGVYDNAIHTAADPDITVAECIAGNTDAATLSGDEVLACFLTWSGTKVPYQLSLGPLRYSNETEPVFVAGATSGTLQRIETQRTGGNNYNHNHHVFRDNIDAKLDKETSSSERERIHLRFEEAAISHFVDLWKSKQGTGFADGEPYESQRFHFTLERSIPDNIHDASSVHPALLVGGFLCLLAYIVFVYSTVRHSVYSHALLALAGVVLIAVSTAASIGLAAYLTLPLTPITSNVVPFVAFGIGIDDVLVILAAYSNEILRHSDAAVAVQRTMADAGPSVSFTSLTNFVAFLIASATPVAIVQYFCWQMVLSVLLNYAVIMLVFVPLLVSDARRVLAGKPDTLIPCGSGSESDKPDRAHPFLDRIFGRYYADALMSTPGRALVIVCACVAIGLSAWQAGEVETGVLFSSVALRGSYQHDFTVLLESDFQMYNGYLVTDTEDLPAAQENILRAVDALQASERVTDSAPIASIFWLHSFLSSATGNSTTPVAEDRFYYDLADWLAALGISFLPDLYCVDARDSSTPRSCYDLVGSFASPADAPPVTVVAARGLFYIQNAAVQSDFLDAIRSTRNAVDPVSRSHDNPDDPHYRTFVISYLHLFWEQYLHSFEDLRLVVGLCLLGIFVATFAFQFSVVTSLLLCAVIFIVDLEVYALLPVLGLTLNAFSLTNLCLAIGMAVEFTAHVAHQFLSEVGDDRKQRVRSTLQFMGTPLFNGLVSSVLAILFILGTDTGFIRDYYFSMFFATLAIAFLNGLVLLPVLLSLVGPAPLASRKYAGADEAAAQLPQDDVEMKPRSGSAQGPGNEEEKAKIKGEVEKEGKKDEVKGGTSGEAGKKDGEVGVIPEVAGSTEDGDKDQSNISESQIALV